MHFLHHITSNVDFLLLFESLIESKEYFCFKFQWYYFGKLSAVLPEGGRRFCGLV